MKMKDIPTPLTGGTYHLKHGKLAKGEPTEPSKSQSPASADRSRKPSREDKS